MKKARVRLLTEGINSYGSEPLHKVHQHSCTCYVAADKGVFTDAKSPCGVRGVLPAVLRRAEGEREYEKRKKNRKDGALGMAELLLYLQQCACRGSTILSLCRVSGADGCRKRKNLICKGCRDLYVDGEHNQDHDLHSDAGALQP